MLKETPKSLRLFFGIVAALSLLFGVAAISQGSRSALVVVPALVAITFGILFAYIAGNFYELISKNPSFIKGVLISNFSLSIVGFGLSLAGVLQPARVGQLLFDALICFYLVRSVARLSSNAVPQNA